MQILFKQAENCVFYGLYPRIPILSPLSHFFDDEQNHVSNFSNDEISLSLFTILDVLLKGKRDCFCGAVNTYTPLPLTMSGWCIGITLSFCQFLATYLVQLHVSAMWSKETFLYYRACQNLKLICTLYVYRMFFFCDHGNKNNNLHLSHNAWLNLILVISLIMIHNCQAQQPVISIMTISCNNFF